MDKFNDKYQIESVKPVNWDLSLTGANLITLCRKDRSPNFGHCAGKQLFWYGARSPVEEYIRDSRLNWQLDLPTLSAQQSIHSPKTGTGI